MRSPWAGSRSPRTSCRRRETKGGHAIRLGWSDGTGVHHYGPIPISEAFWNKITQNGQLTVHQTAIRYRGDDPAARPLIVDDAPEAHWSMRVAMGVGPSADHVRSGTVRFGSASAAEIELTKSVASDSHLPYADANHSQNLWGYRVSSRTCKDRHDGTVGWSAGGDGPAGHTAAAVAQPDSARPAERGQARRSRAPCRPRPWRRSPSPARGRATTSRRRRPASTGSASDVRDVPQSVVIINKALMQSQGATSLHRAVRNVPGRHDRRRRRRPDRQQHQPQRLLGAHRHLSRRHARPRPVLSRHLRARRRSRC